MPHRKHLSMCVVCVVSEPFASEWARVQCPRRPSLRCECFIRYTIYMFVVYMVVHIWMLSKYARVLFHSLYLSLERFGTCLDLRKLVCKDTKALRESGLSRIKRARSAYMQGLHTHTHTNIFLWGQVKRNLHLHHAVCASASSTSWSQPPTFSNTLYSMTLCAR